MNRQEAKAILEYWNANHAINEYIRANFVRKDGERLRRGPVQKQIATALGFTLNPDYYKKINAVMSGYGIRIIKIDGVGFYGELSTKEGEDNEVI